MKKLFSVMSLSILLAACASNQNKTQTVIISSNHVPPGCQYVGKIVGGKALQTNNNHADQKILSRDVEREFQTQAKAMGANYVQIITSRVNVSSSRAQGQGSLVQANLTNTAQAYNCPPNVLADMPNS